MRHSFPCKAQRQDRGHTTAMFEYELETASLRRQLAQATTETQGFDGSLLIVCAGHVSPGSDTVGHSFLAHLPATGKTSTEDSMLLGKLWSLLRLSLWLLLWLIWLPFLYQCGCCYVWHLV